jgi:hypothetical protein
MLVEACYDIQSFEEEQIQENKMVRKGMKIFLRKERFEI